MGVSVVDLLSENLNLKAALARAKQTGGECQAAVWMKNRRTFEWYEWSTCSQDPGHDGPHQLWDDDGNTWWHPWIDGDSGINEMRNYDEIIQTEWRSQPSPWTSAEIALWNAETPT